MTRINCGVPEIRCACGASREYPIPEKASPPPVGTESLCQLCGRIYELVAYRGRGEDRRWSWRCVVVASIHSLALAPLKAEPSTESVSALTAAILHGYGQVESEDFDGNDEVTKSERPRFAVVGRLDGGDEERIGHA